MKKTLLSILIGGLVLTGCGAVEDTVSTPTAAPATAVSVVNATALLHAPVQTYLARIQAIESARLTPRTTGYLEKKYFSDGDLVQKGDILFAIDPTSYRAALQAAQATLSETNAALHVSKLAHQRNLGMLETGGIAQAQIDISTAELAMASSRVLSAEANVEVHQDNLEQTQVRAPYAGQLGKSKFSIGDMVGPNFGPLIDVVMVHPIEASFALKDADLKHFTQNGSDDIKVSMLVDEHELTGELSFIDNKVHPSSGTVAMAAKFNNQSGELIPNQFVRIGIQNSQPLSGVSIPNKAVHQDQLTQYVLVVEDNVVVRRDVAVKDRIGSEVFVKTGLAAGDQVIIGGLQRVRAGASVKIAEE